MKKKDFTPLNVNIDAEVFGLLDAISNLTGKTKSAMVEDAIISSISPFCNYEYDEDGVMHRTCKIIPGLYLEGEMPVGECKILGYKSMMGQPYVKIYKDGQLMSVPEDRVKEI